jgi:hypothetical protein
MATQVADVDNVRRRQSRSHSAATIAEIRPRAR